MKHTSILPLIATFTLGTAGFSQKIQVNNNAPVFTSATIVIHAKPEKVWKILSGINEWNTWLTDVKYSHLNGSLAPNTTFDWKVKGMKIHSTLHTVEPNTMIGWTGKVYGIYAVHNWTFKEVNGATEVTVNESMEGFMAKLFKKSFNKSLAKDMLSSLEMLKKASE